LIAIGIAVDLMRPFLSRWGRIALAITLAVSPLIYVSFGMETLLYIALLMLAYWLWSRDRRVAAMVTAAALTWTRADGVVLAGTFGLLALIENLRAIPDRKPVTVIRALPWTLGLAYLAGIAPWFLFAWSYFGTPLPQTFSAKQEVFAGLLFWKDGQTWWRSFYGNNLLTWLAVPMITFGMWRALRRPRLRPLAIWPMVYISGYTILNVTAFWYYTPLVVVLIILAAFGGDWLAKRFARAGLNRRIVLAGALILVLSSAGLAVIRAWEYHEPPPRMATYKLVGEWIDQHTDEHSEILVKDLGMVGYYAHRYTLDSFGLIVPDMHYTDDTYAAAKYKTDYVVTTQYWEMQRLVAMDWFRYHFVPVVQFSTAGDHDFSPMTVYRRRLDLDTPTEILQGFDLPLTCTVDLPKGAKLPDETRARLIDSSGETLVEVSHPFLWDQYPADHTPADETLIEQIALPLAVDPGDYQWELTCDQTTTGTITVLPIDQDPAYLLPGSASWDEFARLRGIYLPNGTDTWSGGMLSVALHWEALGPADKDYSLFVHLVDANGMVVSQTDGYPRGGSRPTTTWIAGETLVDIREIQLPPNLPPDTYELVIGWYDWQTDGYPRLPLFDREGDALTLPLEIHNQWPGGTGLP
jgi:hypothetical protein